MFELPFYTGFLVLVQPRKTRPIITERLLMGRKESNQTKKITQVLLYCSFHYMMSWIFWDFFSSDELTILSYSENVSFVSFLFL